MATSWKHLTIPEFYAGLPGPTKYWWGCYHATERRVATARILPDECVVPSVVEPGQVFQIKYVYQFGDLTWASHGRHTDPACHVVGGPPMENWEHEHAGYRRVYNSVYPAATQHCFWIWRLLTMKAAHRGEVVTSIGQLSPNQKFTYTWEGTIEDLTGMQFTESTVVTDVFELGGDIYGWYGDEWWPWGWPLQENFIGGPYPWDEVSFDIAVDVPPPPPPPPTPIFVAEYCSISKSTVAPNEQFTLKLRIKNTSSEGEGYYSLWTLCEGHDYKIGEGTIGPNQTSPTMSFPVTANQIFGSEITSDRYLSFSARVRNEEEETDWWGAPTLTVMVPINGDKATVSGIVTDKVTGFDIPNASVSTVGRTVYTDGAGRYSIENLDTGYYEITFKKSEYHDEKKSKLLNAGSNTLNVAMTPTTDPDPVEGEFPWAMVSGGVAILAIGLMLARKGKGGAK